MSDIQKQVDSVIDSLENASYHCTDCECEVTEGEDCPECNGSDIIYNDGFEYLKDALDIEYIIGADRKYLGARVLVCFGGPNVWVNTRTMQVEGYWWGDSCHQSFTDNIGLDDALLELWECGA